MTGTDTPRQEQPKNHAELVAMLPDELDRRVARLIDHMAQRAVEGDVRFVRRGKGRWTRDRSL